MSLEFFLDMLLPAIELELKKMVDSTRQHELDGLYSMIAYHMGWEGEQMKVESQGKRIRPLLVLLSAAAAGSNWEKALPAAVGVELLHNFSLIHDDIQDQSDLRRGRKTVWKIWGIAQAINAGDTLFVMAHQALLGLSKTVSELASLQAMTRFTTACLSLTQGQYLDLSYEKRTDLNLDDYWLMIGGKTAALLSCCTELGAISAQANAVVCENYKNFGKYLGLAFQVLDDLLGVWGDAILTGKSAKSDLLTGKNSLPVLYGIGLKGLFYKRWVQGNILPDEINDLANQLEAEGAKEFTQVKAEELTQKALQCLLDAQPVGDAGEALIILAHQLLKRDM